MKLDVLAIAAHPDDIELSCAATVHKLCSEGKIVGILDLTQGELGTRGSKEIRRKEAEASSKIIGLSMRINLKIPDGGIVVNKKNIIRVIQVVRHYRPDILLFPHWLERHPDHEHANKICRESWFYSGLEKISTKWEGKHQQPHRPVKYFHYMQKYEFQPSFIVDVSKNYDKKKEALAAFSSQFHDPKSVERETMLSSKFFLESVYARDRHFGSLINVEYGEPFYSIEPLGIDSFFNLLMK
jgi:N-acetylglucosamine malate deacetylase 1